MGSHHSEMMFGTFGRQNGGPRPWANHVHIFKWMCLMFVLYIAWNVLQKTNFVIMQQPIRFVGYPNKIASDLVTTEGATGTSESQGHGKGQGQAPKGQGQTVTKSTQFANVTTSAPGGTTPDEKGVLKVPKCGQRKFTRSYGVPKCSTKTGWKVCKVFGEFLSKRDYDIYMDIMGTVLEQAKARKWKHFMLKGTLLGSWRHHGIIPWDGDMDLFMHIDHHDDVLKVFNKTDYTPMIAVQPSHCLRVYSKQSHRKMYWSDIGHWMYPWLDIFFFTENSTHVYDVDDYRAKELTFKRGDIYPLHERPFETFRIPAPKNSYGVTKQLYGESSFKDCRTEGRVKVNCKDLEGYIPFVNRTNEKGKMVEVLLLGKKVLKKEIVDEPKALSKMYGLKPT